MLGITSPLVLHLFQTVAPFGFSFLPMFIPVLLVPLQFMPIHAFTFTFYTPIFGWYIIDMRKLCLCSHLYECKCVCECDLHGGDEVKSQGRMLCFIHLVMICLTLLRNCLGVFKSSAGKYVLDFFLYSTTY